MANHVIIKAGGTLRGQIQVPGDKSISHRALILAALAEGTTIIRGFLKSQDTLSTQSALEAMGVSIIASGETVVVEGVGLHGLKPPRAPIHCGNSGTTMRLLAGVLAAQPFDSVLLGDASLSQRPMDRIIEPLSQMGAKIRTESGKAPLFISGKVPLKGIDYTLPVPSAQVKSSLLLAGLYASGTTRVIEPVPTRDHTEKMLMSFGCPLQWEAGSVAVNPIVRLRGTTVEVPGDFSSAAFFIVGALIAREANLVLSRVGMNTTRTGLLQVLTEMDADITCVNETMYGTEPVADLIVSSTRLRGIEIPARFASLMIDEFPILMVAAAAAQGKTVIRGAAELRVKESDRIKTMVAGLKKLGVQAVELADGAIIEGGKMNGGEIDCQQDHRIAMAFTMAGLQTDQDVVLHQYEEVATSFPHFFTRAQQAGLSMIEV